MSTDTPSHEDDEFQRRCQAAEKGQHFPSSLELLQGMPFFGNTLQEDINEFVRRALASLIEGETTSTLRDRLDTLTSCPRLDAVKEAASECRSEVFIIGVDCEEWSSRLNLYAAALGCNEASIQTALEAICLSNDQGQRERSTPGRLISQALGWIATLEEHFETGEKKADAVKIAGNSLAAGIIESWRAKEPFASRGGAATRDTKSQLRQHTDQTASRRPVCSSEAPPCDFNSVVVITGVGNRHTQDGKRAAVEWRSLIGQPLPLVPARDFVEVRRKLLADFPFATAVIDKLLSELSGRTFIALRPTILTGEPGIGKNRFAESLLRELGVPSWTYPCGGVADSSLAGTSRRWASGEPSLITSLVRQHACASPGVILDEIEKVGSSKYGGNLLDALLAMLEPQTARTWVDPYLQAPVDLSHVIWFGTANDVSELPAPLRDRFRILRFPQPTAEHLPALANNLLVQAISDREHDLRWATPLTAEELECLGRVWTGGSLRRLKRLIEGVLAVRDRDFTLQ